MVRDGLAKAYVGWEVLDLAYFDSTLQAFASPCHTEEKQITQGKESISKSFKATDICVN